MADSALEALIEGLRCLPGVGQKSAQRMAYHLLQHDRSGAVRLARALDVAGSEIGHCTRCHTFSREPVCEVCQDETRDKHSQCAVETPADEAALERTGSYKGLYFVLMGRLSPLDGLGVRDIGVAPLLERSGDGVVQEVILATHLRSRGLRVTRLARGVPVGSELEYVDLGTIAHAFMDRRLATRRSA